MVALKRGYGFIGLFALAFAIGVCGGLLRDGLFIQEEDVRTVLAGLIREAHGSQDIMQQRPLINKGESSLQMTFNKVYRSWCRARFIEGVAPFLD